MTEKITYIPSRVKNATGGNVCGSDDIIDDVLERKQNDINQETVGNGASSLKNRLDSIEGQFQVSGGTAVITTDPEDIVPGSAAIPTANAVAGAFENATTFHSGELVSNVDIAESIEEDSDALAKAGQVYAGLAEKEGVIEDLSTIRSGAAFGATAYQKPSGGIPKTDMASEVQTSLEKADAAAPQSTTYNKTEVDNKVGAINEKIPSQASSSNQLADKDFVNSSIATATATFRGTYNLVSDLSLTVSATQAQIATALATKLDALGITTDNNDYCFVQIPTSVSTPTEIAYIDRYKFNGSDWAFEYTLNNSGFTAAQWAAINSAITSGKVQKLDALPTNSELTTLLNGKESTTNKVTSFNNPTDTQYPSAKLVKTQLDNKQATLQYDSAPTENSQKMVKSGGIWSWATNAIYTAVSTAISTVKSWAENLFLQKGSYDASTAVGMADYIRFNVYADEQFAVRMTGGEANEVGGIGMVQQLKGAGAAISQLFPEGANHDFSGDVSLDGTGGNAEAVVRYSDKNATVEMGYLLAMEAFVSQTLSQAQLDAISAKDTGKADRDKAVWLTPAGAITSAPTIESGQTEVTFSGWRIAMRVKASEVRDASASGYWFTSGTAGRQVFDVAVAEGIEEVRDATTNWQWVYALANGWHTKSAMEYLQHMAAQGLPTHQVKAMSALLSVTKIGIKTVKSRNLLNPQTGRALLKAYVNDDENFLDNEYTMLGGLPSGSTMAFTSLLTGKTETLTMLDSTHFVIPSDGWLQITGTLPTSIIATWDGTKDNTAADEYATESHVWDVTQLFGTKDGGTEGHYYRAFGEGMTGARNGFNIVDLPTATASCPMRLVDMGNLDYTTRTFNNHNQFCVAGFPSPYQHKPNTLNSLCSIYTRLNLNTAMDKVFGLGQGFGLGIRDDAKNSMTPAQFKASVAGEKFVYELATPLTFTSLFLSASSTADELTAMPADAIPLSEIQFADNNWSIEEAIYDAPEADANGVITPTAVTGQMRIQYSLDAAEQIDTLQKEYQALEARVTALENA